MGSGSEARERKRGFAVMNPERQRELARLGGRKAHELGTAHEWNTETARAAGRKGGKVVAQKPGHMAMIGQRGGKARKH
jgi:uncharacterized protein